MMYAIRTCQFVDHTKSPAGPSGKPDGMFLRQDGMFTESKTSARLFDTAADAEAYSVIWRADPELGGDSTGDAIPLYLVEVETKPVVKKVGKLVKAV